MREQEIVSERVRDVSERVRGCEWDSESERVREQEIVSERVRDVRSEESSSLLIRWGASCEPAVEWAA